MKDLVVRGHEHSTTLSDVCCINRMGRELRRCNRTGIDDDVDLPWIGTVDTDCDADTLEVELDLSTDENSVVIENSNELVELFFKTSDTLLDVPSEVAYLTSNATLLLLNKVTFLRSLVAK